MNPRALIATFLVTLLLAPAYAVASEEGQKVPDRPVPPMPDDLLALAEKWEQQDRDALAEVGETEWRQYIENALEVAKEHREDGRFRSAFDKHKSARVSLAFYTLWDELQALESPDQRQARLVAFGDTHNANADRAFERYRERLHALEGDLSSLRAVEVALYATTHALDARDAERAYDAYRREASNAPDPNASTVLGVVDHTYGALITLSLASDLLGAAEAREGVKPRINETAYANLTRFLKQIPADPKPQPHMATYLRVLNETRTTSESLLAVAAWLSSMRAEAYVTEQFKFQDAAGRGIGALSDIRENVNSTLELPILEAYTARGYDGILARDAIDFAWAVMDGQRQDVPVYVRAWIELVHANFTARTLGAWSPVQPPVETQDEGPEPKGFLIPAITPAALVGSALAAALALSAKGRTRHRRQG